MCNAQRAWIVATLVGVVLMSVSTTFAAAPDKATPPVAKPAAPNAKPATPSPKPAATPAAATKSADATKPAEAAKPAETKPESTEDAAPGPLPGHSTHGEAFDDGPRQAAVLIPGCGEVHFPVTTKQPLVQKFIDQGIGQLHGFWYFEAERSFRQAASLDPDCASAYWGMAMANVNNEKRAKSFISEALKRKDKASAYEKLWIEALNEYYADPKKKDVDRRKQYVRRLENIVHEYPDDLEAKAFLLLQIYVNHGKGITISSYEAASALGREIFAKNAKHPAHHYIIHLWDSEKPQRALHSAAWGGPSSPAIAHMWHMPGHTYSHVKRYADGVWQQEAASRVDHAQMMQFRIMPDQIHNYAHNHEWLIRNLNYIGQPHKGIQLATNLIEMPRHPKHNGGGKSGAPNFGRTRLLETAVRYELWDELIELSERGYLDPQDDANLDMQRVRALGAAYFAKGRKDDGLKLVADVEARLAKLKKEQDDAGTKAEKEAQDKKQPADKVTKAKTDARNGFNARVTTLEHAIQSLKGHEQLAAGDGKQALAHFLKAGNVSKELLSRVHFAAGDKAKAEQSALEAKNAADKQVHPLANYVDILQRVGKTKEAQDAFKQLRDLARHTELDAPIFKRLAPVAKALNLPDDWRLKPESATDIGPRPDLDSLGPLAWRPSPAPGFQLPDANGKQISLAQYRGKPVVLIFYLGFGCVHCVEQLRAFKPMTEEFQRAGIEILAVSTDSVADIKKSLVDAKQDGKYPFPIVSDNSMQVFKAYRAYDDFEKLPLHATLLLDPSGNVLWQDISYEPFADAKFMLKESQRLLKLGHGPVTTQVKR